MMSLNLNQLMIPLDRPGFARAHHLAAQQATVAKGKQVYLNTLAVWAVHTYLTWLGIESDPAAGEGWQTSLSTVLDGADLMVPGVGRLECRPVLPGTPSFTIPLEATCDRIGYVAVQFHDSLDTVELLGFLEPFPADSPCLEPPVIALDDLLPLDALLNALHPINNLRQWLQGMGAQDRWQSPRLLVATSRGSTAEPGPGVSQARRIDLGESLQQAVVLVIGVRPTQPNTDGQADSLTVRLSLYSPRGVDHLPRQLRVSILSDLGLVLREARTREEDLEIGLELTDCRPGEQFSVVLTLGGVSVVEEFQA
jgi:hypothetical protein